MPAPVIESAPAKLNLFLHVTGKREDHYHLLESLVVFTDFGDTLEMHDAAALTLDIAGPYAAALAAAEGNLIVKAAEALRRHSGCRRGARIVLHKRIPLSAGLGGGSADAAAALRGLTRLWDLGIDNEALHQLAASLGSDVPVCLRGQPAVMRGVGEQLSPMDIEAPAWVVLANPDFPLATADVYRRFTGPFSVPAVLPSRIDGFDALLAAIAAGRNDLQVPAVALQPAIKEMLAAITATPRCRLSRMAGSGATCFGLFADADDAARAVQQLRRDHPQWWLCETRVKNKRPLPDWKRASA